MEKKEKGGWLRGDLGKVFRKYALVGLTAVAALGPLAGTAQAQNGTISPGVTVTQTQQQEDLKPWANDPAYVQQIELWQQQSRLRMEVYNRNIDARMQAVNAANMRVINGHIQQGKRTGSDGWSVMDVLQTGSQVGATQSRYNAQMTQLRNAKMQANINEQLRLQRLEDRLDAQYARQYLTQQQQQQRQQQLEQRQQQNTGGTALTPEQQHDRLVRAYQDAQLRSAQSGGRIAAPTPGQFGLDAKDPAIQVPQNR